MDLLNEQLSLGSDDPYVQYLNGIHVKETHKGYFSIDKRSSRFIDSKVSARETDSDDADAYDLIMRDKERLLSFEEPTRFIFSHSALKEGWDNPNVFQICTLKYSDSAVKKKAGGRPGPQTVRQPAWGADRFQRPRYRRA